MRHSNATVRCSPPICYHLIEFASSIANAGEPVWIYKDLPGGQAREAHGYTRPIHAHVAPLKPIVVGYSAASRLIATIGGTASDRKTREDRLPP